MVDCELRMSAFALSAAPVFPEEGPPWLAQNLSIRSSLIKSHTCCPGAIHARGPYLVPLGSAALATAGSLLASPALRFQDSYTG